MSTRKTKRGLHRQIGAPGLPGAGRPAKLLTERAAPKGRIAIHISVEAAALLQQLMFDVIDGVNTPEQMIEHLIRQAISEAPGGTQKD